LICHLIQRKRLVNWDLWNSSVDQESSGSI
jgi:hypothetical protein